MDGVCYDHTTTRNDGTRHGWCVLWPQQQLEMMEQDMDGVCYDHNNN